MFKKIRLSKSIIFLLICLIVFGFNFYLYKSFTKINNSINQIKESTETNRHVTNFVPSFVETEYSRDFYRYKCKNRKRIGADPTFVNRVPDILYRIEGAWFICLDDEVAPIKDDCIVLSFGINRDESFDVEMDSLYKCQIESFDPYIENTRFKNIRDSDVNLKDAVTLKVNEKWRFHRIGLIGNEKSVKNINQIGWMAKLDDILNYTELNKKVIDIFKLDIDNGEWEFFKNLDMDYFCKYVKQFMLETHTPEVVPDVKSVKLKEALKLMRNLEKCFLLFHRDTRFYKDGKVGKYGFWKSEFQEPIEYKIPLIEFKDELHIIDFMVTYGELYFVNKNFLK